MSDQPAFRLNPQLDIDGARARFAERGRAYIADFLDERSAKRLLTAFEMEKRWVMVTHLAGRHVDLDAAEMAKRSPNDQAQLVNLIYEQAQRDFQYHYLNYPIYHAYHDGKAPGHLFNALLEFLNAPPVLDVIREATGAADIAFLDAQATRYERGHFLTLHDDTSDSNSRRAAYVLSMTPDWRADWGGLTLFFDEDGQAQEAFTPRFNRLNLFRVPQPHAVSVIAPFAPKPRFSVTGWAHAGKNPRGEIG